MASRRPFDAVVWYPPGWVRRFAPAMDFALLLPAPRTAVVRAARTARCATVTVVGDVPAAAELTEARVRRVAAPSLNKVLAALGGNPASVTLLLDASAILLEPTTLEALAAACGRADVAVLGGHRHAVALSAAALRRLKQSQRSAKLTALEDVVELLSNPAAQFRLKSVPGAAYEQTIQTVEGAVSLAQQRRLQRALAFASRGLRLEDPTRVDIDGELIFGKRVSIGPGTILKGRVVLGDDVSIGPSCILEDVEIGRETTVKAFSSVSEAILGAQCRIGPYARIRPATWLGDGTHIGNFVEVKNTRMGRGCKVNHHSFIGDARLGDRVIIGAGSITCNFDGTKANPTVIHENAFVGSGVMLVAPLTIGRNAFVAAGSTVVKDAPAGGLTIARARQELIRGWAKRRGND